MANNEIFLLTFFAGIAAFFNPCGFALLPAYVSYSLAGGLSANTWVRSGLMGLLVGGATSAGFLTVFVSVGLVFSSVGMKIMKYMPWLALVVGGGLILLGVWMLFHQSLSITSWLESWAARISSRADSSQRGSSLRGVRFYYLYGVGYAICSIGCTLPLFLAYVVTLRTDSFFSEMLKFVSYAAGMTLMMFLLSLALAYSKGGFRKSRPLVMTASVLVPLLLIFAIVQLPKPAQALAGLLSGTNQIVVPAFAAALALMLLFWACGWLRLFQAANALILVGAGSYLIWYQWHGGLIHF